MQMNGRSIASAEIGFVITRADGTIEDYSDSNYVSSNPLKTLWFKIKRYFSRLELHIKDEVYKLSDIKIVHNADGPLRTYKTIVLNSDVKGSISELLEQSFDK